MSTGPWYSWNSNGTKHSLYNYKNGTLDGKYIYWNADNTVNTNTYYIDGVDSGLCISDYMRYINYPSFICGYMYGGLSSKFYENKVSLLVARAINLFI